MTKRRVWRYRCDHCGKSGCSGGHMRRHEESCTKNLNRRCRMHLFLDDGTPNHKSVLEMVTAVRSAIAQEKRCDPRAIMPSEAAEVRIMQALRAASDNCPACMLAVTRYLAGDCPRDPEDLDYWAPAISFKKECERFWASDAVEDSRA